MINANMRLYNYSTLGANNEYGQAANDGAIKGTIKMAINLTSISVQDNINYKDAKYMGLTKAPIDDSYIIHYGEEKLKVLYVYPQGKYKQVFMSEI